MTLDNDDILNSIMASLDRIDQVNINDIPNIDLYMDQVTTFMDEKLKKTTRYPNDDKILTKTMINNYAKNDLLPPPVRKKYSKDHLILLIFIYYFKNILSINDIQTLLEPVKERFHISDQDSPTMSDIYSVVYEEEKSQLADLKKDIQEKYAEAGNNFKDVQSGLKEELQLFSFISQLSYDIYIKKLIIEKILDNKRTAIKAEQDAERGKQKK